MHTLEGSVTLYVRGQLVTVEGYIEPADRSVGIMGDTFILEGCNDPQTGAEIFSYDNLTDGEVSDIEQAYCDTVYGPPTMEWEWTWLIDPDTDLPY